MGDSEQNLSAKLSKIKSKSSKKVIEVIDCLGKMQKLKAESLKKTEELFESAMHDLEKLEQKVASSKDLPPGSRPKLNNEIAAARMQVKQKYDDLKTRITAEILPK